MAVKAGPNLWAREVAKDVYEVSCLVERSYTERYTTFDDEDGRDVIYTQKIAGEASDPDALWAAMRERYGYGEPPVSERLPQGDPEDWAKSKANAFAFEAAVAEAIVAVERHPSCPQRSKADTAIETAGDAFLQSEETVREAISRMEAAWDAARAQHPVYGAKEARHSGEWVPEPAPANNPFAAALAGLKR